MNAGGRFTTAAANGMVCAAMNELRELRHATGLGQREFAALLSIPLETFRPWDSGRRVVSVAVLQLAREAAAHHARRHELLTLSLLAPGIPRARPDLAGRRPDRPTRRPLLKEENTVTSPLAAR